MQGFGGQTENQRYNRQRNSDFFSSDSELGNITPGVSQHDINLDAPVTKARMADRRQEEQELVVDANQVDVELKDLEPQEKHATNGGMLAFEDPRQ